MLVSYLTSGAVLQNRTQSYKIIPLDWVMSSNRLGFIGMGLVGLANKSMALF
jgi:hypothetical protein